MENLLKEYEDCLQAVYDKHVALLPNEDEVAPDKGTTHLIPFSTELEAESERIGKLLVPKLVGVDYNVFRDRTIAIKRAIYQKYMDKLGDVKTSISDNQDALFLP